MMHIGQHVLFLGNPLYPFKDANWGVKYPVKGKVYTIRSIAVSPETQMPYLSLVEIVNPKLTYAFDNHRHFLERPFVARWFKPLRKLTLEDFSRDVKLIPIQSRFSQSPPGDPSL